MWKKGQIIVEADSSEEMISTLKKLEGEGDIEELPTISEMGEVREEIPKISGNLGLSDAIRTILTSPWGKKEPRTLADIKEVLKTNALYFEDHSLSGVLVSMTKRGKLKRTKRDGKWAYISPT